MTTYHGLNGVVKVGGSPSTVLEVTGFEVTEQIDTADDSVQGDTWKTHLTGLKSWTATIEANAYSGDSTGQATLTVGASVACEFYPEGEGAGLQKLAGSGTVTSRPTRSNKDGIVTVSFSVTGNGALTESDDTA